MAVIVKSIKSFFLTKPNKSSIANQQLVVIDTTRGIKRKATQQNNNQKREKQQNIQSPTAIKVFDLDMRTKRQPKSTTLVSKDLEKARKKTASHNTSNCTSMQNTKNEDFDLTQYEETTPVLIPVDFETYEKSSQDSTTVAFDLVPSVPTQPSNIQEGVTLATVSMEESDSPLPKSRVNRSIKEGAGGYPVRKSEDNEIGSASVIPEEPERIEQFAPASPTRPKQEIKLRRKCKELLPSQCNSISRMVTSAEPEHAESMLLHFVSTYNRVPSSKLAKELVTCIMKGFELDGGHYYDVNKMGLISQFAIDYARTLNAAGKSVRNPLFECLDQWAHIKALLVKNAKNFSGSLDKANILEFQHTTMTLFFLNSLMDLDWETKIGGDEDRDDGESHTENLCRGYSAFCFDHPSGPRGALKEVLQNTIALAVQYFQQPQHREQEEIYACLEEMVKFVRCIARVYTTADGNSLDTKKDVTFLIKDAIEFEFGAKTIKPRSKIAKQIKIRFVALFVNAKFEFSAMQLAKLIGVGKDINGLLL